MILQRDFFEEHVPESYKSNIYKFYIYQFIFGIHTVRGVFYAYMTDWGGLNLFEIMALQSYFMFVVFLFEIPSGAIADYIGRKTALILSAASVVCAAFIYSYIVIYIIKSIITQNIDNLHQEAGSNNVLEFHGTSQTLTCVTCNNKYNSTMLLESIPPYCPKCNGLLKPDFVFFGEPIPQEVLSESIKEASLADVFLLIGTTGEIMPASTIPYIAEKNRAKFIEINIEESKYTNSIVDVFLKGKASEVLLKLKEFLS